MPVWTLLTLASIWICQVTDCLNYDSPHHSNYLQEPSVDPRMPLSLAAM